MAAGRDFSKDYPTEKDGFLINEIAARDMNYKDPVGKYITVNGRHGQVIGVIKNFNFRSLHETIRPMVVDFNDSLDYGSILVRTAAGKSRQVIASVEKLCKELNPEFPFTFSFVDEEYNKLYNSEQVVSRLSDAFAFLAILISCLGLLGLVMFTAEQRTKEIGIRKVLGASVANIVRLMSSDFLKLVVVAIIIASPIAWWAMHAWLSNYAYKIDITWWIFVAAGGLIVLIALATISFQSIKAAMANPVKSLRTE